MNPMGSNYNPYDTTGSSSGGYGMQQRQQANPYAAGYGAPAGTGYDMDPSAAAAGPVYYGAVEGGSYMSQGNEYDWQQQQNQQQHQPQDLEQIAASTEPGSYYQLPTVIEPELLYGVALSGVAYDTTYDAMCVTSVATSSATTNKRYGAHQNRVSRMLTHDLANGGMLYSSVASHPQAPAKVLQSVYAAIYGEPSLSSSPTKPSHPRQGHNVIPKHAYQPPYGSTDPAVLADTTASITGNSNRNSQMGVTTLLPLLPEGNVASVSPSGVRIHAGGGLQLADHHVEGMLAGTPHPQSGGDSMMTTHITVGGMALGSNNTNGVTTAGSDHHLHCMDLWQGLRIVASHTFDRKSRKEQQQQQQGNRSNLAVTCLGTSHSRGCVVAGCSDGTLRLVDNRSRDMLAKIKSHRGGVVDVAVASGGSLVATTGYGSTALRSQPCPLYGFPDPTILINDIRYLGRGGYPHQFALNGPRFVKFLPEIEGQPSNRLLIASGQAGGGLQIITPFQDNADSTNFIMPPLAQGEAISCMCVSEDKFALGSTRGKVLQYQMAGYQPKSILIDSAAQAGAFVPSSPGGTRGAVSAGSTSTSTGGEKREKIPLEVPPFQPPTPPVSLDANILLKNDPNTRSGRDESIKSIFGTYLLTADPLVSALGDRKERSLNWFRPWITGPVLAQSSYRVSVGLTEKASHTDDFLLTIPSSNLGIDLFDDHRTKRLKDRDKRKKKQPMQNPNKLIYTRDLYKLAYVESLNRTKRHGRQGPRDGNLSGSDSDDGDQEQIPQRYRLMLRPMHRLAASFNHAEYNQTDTVPGFDYPITMPNAFVPPVLLLLFFIPEVRDAALKAHQFSQALMPMKDRTLISEIGFLFHRIECIARFGMLFSAAEFGTNVMTRLDAWAPSAIISLLATMPEAERFQILDGSPAAVESPRRPEAFYRFLMYQLDSELGKNGPAGLLDSLSGTDFVSINEFISGSGPPSKTTTRNLTVELSYDYFFGKDYKSKSKPCFGDVLQYNLCRATRLRAWNQSSKTYETIVQRKIVTSLPAVLSLSAACAGRKETEGLAIWQNDSGENNHWVPEMIEIEIEESGSVIVRELVHDEKTGSDTWKECRGDGSLPPSVSEVVKGSTKSGGPRKLRYRLEAVVSMIRDDTDRKCPEEVRETGGEGPFGHHVLHVRLPHDRKKRIIQEQIDAVEEFLSAEAVEDVTDMTLVGRSTDNEVLQKRMSYGRDRLKAMDEKGVPDDWVLVNGFVVSNTFVEDARAFRPKFKEPSLVVFRAVDSTTKGSKKRGSPNQQYKLVSVPPEVIMSSSLTNDAPSFHSANQRLSLLPGKGDLVAFDAEFVAVAEEESTLTLTGSKVIIRETRHALARVSVLDGRADSAGSVIFDDYVLPNEEVTDYLTRFSGIVAQDLSPKYSKHHLISTRSAYLKLRCMVERGCVFVGHGLQQDFWTANLAVPASQIIDTVDIYHKPAQRYISLRFLTNFVLKRDMQRDVHDSVEDALAAFELYKTAVELKRRGEFDKMLDELYEYGHKTDWKLGIEDESDGV